MFYKPEFRKKISERRSQLGKEAITQAAIQTASQLVMLPAFLKAKRVAYYMAAHGECDPIMIAHTAHLLGKALFLPVMQPGVQDSIAFYAYEWGSVLTQNHYGIKEPVIEGKTPVDPHSIDCYLVPLVGFDVHGHRLGRGAGYYDRYLSFTKTLPKNRRPVMIGLGYEFQKISEIIPDAWDVPMDYVVTETTIYERI